MNKPAHGGNIKQAAKQFGIPVSDWLDLSTGISPYAYPVPAIPIDVFQHLPYADPALLAAASDYYQPAGAITAVCGTQAAIELLPSLLPEAPVLLPDIGYQEHHWHWQQCCQQRGQAVFRYAYNNPAAIDQLLQKQAAHLLLINPNNPGGHCFDQAQIITWASQLGPERYLIIDEAFMDLTPDDSVLARNSLPDNIIVLRSFGKFFGLAGLRLGFVLGNATIMAALEQGQLTWGISGPTQFIGQQALLDKHWQAAARENILQASAITSELLKPLCAAMQPLNQSGLFLSFQADRRLAWQCYEHFGRQGILIRLIENADEQAILRFGLVAHDDTQAVDRLQAAMRTLPLP